MLPRFPCSTRVAWWRHSAVDLLYEQACKHAALTSHPCLTYRTWTDIGVSVLVQSLVSVDWRLWGGDHFHVMRGFLHVSMVQVLGTPVLDQLYCLCHPVTYWGVWGLLLTQELAVDTGVKRASLSASSSVHPCWLVPCWSHRLGPDQVPQRSEFFPMEEILQDLNPRSLDSRVFLEGRSDVSGFHRIHWAMGHTKVLNRKMSIFFFLFVRWKLQSPRWRWQCVIGPPGHGKFYRLQECGLASFPFWAACRGSRTAADVLLSDCQYHNDSALFGQCGVQSTGVSWGGCGLSWAWIQSLVPVWLTGCRG